MKKQIVYKKEIEEDDVIDPRSDDFRVFDSNRQRDWPYSKQDVTDDQKILERIDFFWSLKTSKSAMAEIPKE
jgi:hypothetical protein